MNILSAPGASATSRDDGPSRLDLRIERLKVRHLRLLDRIGGQGSLSAAAASIGISQPGATKLLRELEEALGCRLIERSAKGGQLTTAGRQALDRLRVALGALDTAVTALESQPELPLVRVGMLPLVGIDALSHVVARLSADASLPRLQLRMGTAEGLLQLLAQGQVDCVVGSLAGDLSARLMSRMNVTPLWSQPLVVVAAPTHPLARRRKVSLQEVLRQDWILMPRGSATRESFERLFLNAGLAPPPARIEADSFHIGLGLAASTPMLAVVPMNAFRQARVSVRQVALQPAFQPGAIVLLTPSGTPPLPAVELLGQAFMQFAAQLPASG